MLALHHATIYSSPKIKRPEPESSASTPALVTVSVPVGCCKMGLMESAKQCFNIFNIITTTITFKNILTTVETKNNWSPGEINTETITLFFLFNSTWLDLTQRMIWMNYECFVILMTYRNNVADLSRVSSSVHRECITLFQDAQKVFSRPCFLLFQKLIKWDYFYQGIFTLQKKCSKAQSYPNCFFLIHFKHVQQTPH